MRLGKSRTNFFFTLGAEIGVIRSFSYPFVMILLGYSSLCFLMFALLSFFGPYGLGWLFLGLVVFFRLKFAEFLFSVCISMDGSSCFSHIFLHFYVCTYAVI